MLAAHVGLLPLGVPGADVEDLTEFGQAALQGLQVVVLGLYLGGVPVRPVLVGGNNEASSSKRAASTLELHLHRAVVEQAQQVVVLDPAVELVDDDSGLAVVSLPPDLAVSLGEEIGVRETGSRRSGLAGSGGPVEYQD